MKKLVLFSALLAATSLFAEDGWLSRPAGIKIGQRMTLRPYVSFSYTYDSNADSRRDSHGEDASYWTANPGMNLDYQGDNWKLDGRVYYNRHEYSSGRTSQHNHDSYGEQLGFHWTNIENGGAGWAVILSERYTKTLQDDDFSESSGRGLWRDRQQFDATVQLQRRFNENWHSSLNAGYYWLDYDNDSNTYAPLYGWDRWNVGTQIGFTASKWTDIFLAGTYQGYRQDNIESADGDRDSKGYTVHIGLGSYMTDRISYSVSAGYSRFEYSSHGSADGFTYEGDIRWKIGETWTTSLLFASYYHPSERTYGSAQRCDSVSWGLAKSLVRGKLNATLDISYRHNETEYSSTKSGDWDLNLITARLGLNYTLNRLLTVFARGEYQNELNEGSAISSHYDYERWRLTVGLKFTY